MSRTYSSWRSLSSPNIRSSSTSENPITAFSGVRSSCDMLARNSDLCWLATSSSRVFRSSSRNTRALWMATTDWLASVSSRSTVSAGNAPGTVRRTTSAPTIASSRRSGSTTIERHPCAPQRVDVRVGRLGVEIRRLAYLARGGRVAHERLMQPDPDPTQRTDQLVARAGARAQHELLGIRLELEDRAAVRSRELGRARDDRRQDLVEIEGRAHRLADLAERAELVDRSRQLRAALLELLEELDVPDRDRTLGRERRDELDPLLVERIDPRAPERDHSQHAVVGQHRHAEHRAEAAELACPRPLVPRIHGRVGDLHGASFEPDEPHKRPGTLGHGVVREVLAIRLRTAEHDGDPIDVAIELVDHAGVGRA